MKIILLIGFIFLCSFDGCESQMQGKEVVFQGEKIKGVCLVAPRKPIDNEVFTPIKSINSEWIAVMPYGFVRLDSLGFHYSKKSAKGKWQWWGETVEGTQETIEQAHKAGLKVMIKPHVWVQAKRHEWGNNYTGDLDLKSEADWLKLEKDYREYLLDFAKVADSTNAEIYCIATEFKTFVKKRPQFWFDVIKEIKQIYKGKLTYAENWDCFEAVSFWNEMDYIGIDGYFPLAEEQNPSLATLKKGWKEHIHKIEKTARKYQKPILFTEFGYQSTDFSTQKPWESYSKHPDNLEIQANALQAVFEEVFTKKWFAGGFVWKWFPELIDNEHARDKYSPQFKPAEKVIEKYFGTK